ncbi:MAG: tripartite tricarboxylate transporter TctB family protein [Mailhella sp.]|nr:tripartite tricarboxylate transporter TctB family protein [Mailhella sp.]
MNQNRWTGLGFIILCALLWFAIIPWQTEGAEEAFVPRLATAGMFIPSLILFLHPGGKDKNTVSGVPLFMRVTLPAMLLILAFICSVTRLGFFASSAAFMLLALALFGERRPLAFVIAPAALLGGVWLVMAHFLHLDLPKGMFF